MLSKSKQQITFRLFLFGLGFAVFHIAPVFLNFDIWNKLMIADIFDLTTPYVMILLVWYVLAFRKSVNIPQISRTVKWLFFLGAVTFIEGHGMHLSSNAIHRLVQPDISAPLHKLTYFFDERLGHILWDSGNILLGLSILLYGFRRVGKPIYIRQRGLIFVGASFYGFTYFANAVEGQTVVFTFPYAILLAVLLFILNHRGRWQATNDPIPLFFLSAAGVSIILFLTWFIWQGGFPEFSSLGWIYRSIVREPINP